MAAKLYQFVSSPFCAKVRKILAFKGIDFEVIEVDYLERKELVAASGQLMVPALTLDSGETVVDSTRIAMRLEELQPEPTLFPPAWRGIHLALADYLDNQVEDILFRAAIPDELAHWRARGRDSEALWRLVRERKFGAGFVDRMVAESEGNWRRAREVLAQFDDALAERAFLLGRIGFADFALYGQLYYFAFRGELKIPAELANLRAFFGRMDRISSAPETF
jgi:glutathione S-transferase